MNGRGNRGRRAARAVATVATALLLAGMVGAHPAAAARRDARLPAWVAPWQRLLDRAVVVVSAPGAPLTTRVDYTTLATARDRDATLATVHAALLSVSPTALDDRARLAWAIDTYNFLVIERVVRQLSDTHGARIASVRDIPGFFDSTAVTIADHPYSLQQFEGTFVFPDRNATHPLDVKWRLDPRAHFALTVGAVGSPPLQPQAYLPDSLDAQLERATRETLASPLHLRFDDARGTLLQSAIFGWYPWDFDMRGWDFLVAHAPPEVRAGIARHHLNQPTDMLDWDWTLNQAPAR